MEHFGGKEGINRTLNRFTIGAMAIDAIANILSQIVYLLWEIGKKHRGLHF